MQNKINKPWGFEIIWSHCNKFVGKILSINKGHKLSRQYHVTKEETILVLSGTLALEIGKEEKIEKINLKKGQSYHITPGLVHRFCADYGDVELAEVSTPELEDVVRIEDDYDRSK
jgi:mannose-6-phosphate isomerase